MPEIVAFALGVVLLQQQPQLPPWPGALLSAAALAWLAARRLPARALRRGALLVLAMALGFFWAAWRAELRLAEALDPAWEGRDLRLVGVVAGLPQEFPGGTRCDFAVEQVLAQGVRVPKLISLAWYQGSEPEALAEAPRLHPGERWEWTVRLRRPHGNANPQAFDYEGWLLERGIRATGHVRPGPRQRLADFVPGWGYAIERGRDVLRDSFRRRLPAEQYPLAGVLLALAMGDQKAIAPGKLELKPELAV